MTALLVTVDNRLRFPLETPVALIKLLKAATSHTNPDFSKKRAMGLWVGDTPSKLNTWRDDNGFSMPRGTTTKIRAACNSLGITLRLINRRISAPVVWEPFKVILRAYQEEGVDACLQFQQGIVRAPTGSGKTTMALACLPKLGQRALVIVRDRNLLEQWLDRAVDNLGIRHKDIGTVASGKRRLGTHLTVALQQTLYSKSFPLQDFCQMFGAVIVDEVHDTAAKTVNDTVDVFPAKARLGFSADHTRKDRKECLIEDQFGDVIYEVGKKNLERGGAIVPVVVRLVPTEFKADWYTYGDTADRDFTRLITQMSTDPERCKLVRRVVLELVDSGNVPALVFTHRREHAARLAERELPADGIPTGLLLGSQGNADQFEESKSLLLSGRLKVAVGTFKSVGQGIDIPNVMAGVCATPIGNNNQFFNQVRGRICRVVPGKTVGHLYYLWDSMVFPDAAKNLWKWNDGLVETFDREKNRWVAIR